MDEIHSGTYLGDGLFSGKSSGGAGAGSLKVSEAAVLGDVLVLTAPSVHRRNRLIKVEKSTIEAFEKGATPKKKRQITPEEFLKIKLVMEENGRLGERVRSECGAWKKAKEGEQS